MNRNELIEALKPYFKITELVCPHCYNKFKDKSWQFLSTELLSTLYILRTKVLNKPMIVNTWANGGQFSQRGLRCNMCQLVKDKKSIYLSAHTMGSAIDFNASGMTTEQVYDAIRNNIDKFEYPIRMEITSGNWNHIDIFHPYGSSDRLTEFYG